MSSIEQKLNEVEKILAEVQARLYKESQYLNLDVDTDLKQEQELSFDAPTLSSLQDIFDRINSQVLECEEKIVGGDLSRDFILQSARILLGAQKELQSALGSDQIGEIYAPFQAIGIAMKQALTGDYSALVETLNELKQLSSTLVACGYIVQDI